MITGLLVHDSRMFLDEAGNYYKISTDNEHYKRYFLMADSVRVCMRTKYITAEEAEKMHHIHLSNFEIVSCPSITELKTYAKNRKKTVEILENEVKNSDFVVLKMPGFFCDIAYKYIKKYHKPFLAELGGCPWDALWNHGIRGKILAPYQYWKTKNILSHTDYALYVTNKFLQKRYPARGIQVNCSNVVIDTPEQIVLDLRLTHIDNNNGDLIIGTTAGVDIKYKGQQYIIEAIGRLKQRGIKHFRYQLVGSGDPSYLKSVAQKFNVCDQIDFLGVMPKTKVLEWLETIDIYAQPSRQEGLPRALIEAMSRGVPAIGAKTAGIPELLESEYIFSNSKHNIEEICDILLKMNKNVRKTQAIRNFHEAKHYEKEIINARRNDFYMKFLKENNYG